MGKAKGFLTYDEVNEHMPENIVSSDQMDDWLSAFSGEGIEIVDSSSKIKVQKGEAAEAESEEEDEEEAAAAAKKEEAEEEEDADGYSKTNDPVRMYLRKMGSVSLLTREGEVEIAKRIEDGERRVLQVVLNSSVAIEEILNLGDKLRKQKIRVKEVVKDADEEDAEFDEQWHIERVCKVIDKIRRLWKEQEKVAEKLDAKAVSEPTRKKYKKQITDLKQEILDALQEMRFNKKQIDKIVLKLKELVERIEQANREIIGCEHKSGLSIKELQQDAARDPLVSAAPARHRQEARHPPRRDRGDVAGHRQRAQEGQARRGRGQADRARPARHGQRDPGRRADGREGQGASWSRPTCGWWSRSPRSTPTAACSSST